MSEEKKDALAVSTELPPPIAAALKTNPQAAKLTRLAAFTPTSLTEAISLAKLMSRSELVPVDYRGKPENILIAMQYSAELGVPPMTGLQNISVINGRASVWGDLFLALIQSSPEYEWHKEYFEGEPYKDSYGAVCVMKRKGSEPHIVKFTVAMAKMAKLWQKKGYNGKDTPWITSPDRMMQMRARGFCGRDKFSDALKGLIIAEEAMDIPIDTSEAKQARDKAALDIQSTVVTTGAMEALAPSNEPNRGHGNEGLQRSTESQEQPAKKQDDYICGDCGVKNGHDKDCKYFGKDTAKAEQERKTSKPSYNFEFLVISAEHVKKSGKEWLEVMALDTGGNGNEYKLYCFKKSIWEWLKPQARVIAEMTDTKKNDRTYPNLEHLLNVNGKTFVEDKPVDSEEEMPPDMSE